MQLTSTGDFVTVSDETSILQTAQNRCLSEIGTWLYDENFGNTLSSFVKQESVWNITDEVLKNHTDLALKDMVDDGRIQEVKYAKVISRTSDSMFVEI